MPAAKTDTEPTKLGVDEFLERARKHDLVIVPWSHFCSDPDLADNSFQSFPEDDDDQHGTTYGIVPGSKHKEESVIKNPISMIHEYCQSNGWDAPDFKYKYQSQKGVFVCIASAISAGNVEYEAIGEASTKKEAKTKASKLLLQNIARMYKQNAPKTRHTPYGGQSVPAYEKENVQLTTPSVGKYGALLGNSNSGAVQKNFIQHLHEYCAKTQLPKPVYDIKQMKDLKHHSTVTINNCIGHGIHARKQDSKDKASEDVLKKLKARKGSNLNFFNF